MLSARCDRCGAAVSTRAVLCPVCHALVGDLFGGPTIADVDDDVVAEDFDAPTLRMPVPLATQPSLAPPDPLDPPTVRIKGVRRGDRALASFEEPTGAITPKKADGPAPVATAPSAPASSTHARQVPAPVFDGPPTDPTGAADDPFAPRLTTPIHHNGILRSPTDAVVLGDAGDIAGSLLIEQPSGDVDNDFLSAATGAGLRQMVPVQVYLGRDIAEALTAEVVLRIKDGVDIDWVPLSAHERLVVAEIDGRRPIARLESRLGMAGDDLKLTLALLLDKGVVGPAGVALKRRSAPAGNAAGDDDNTVPAPAPPKGARSLLASMFDERPVQGDHVGLHDLPTAPMRAVVARADRAQARQFHAAALQAVQDGDMARGWQLACLAREADPDDARARETIARWPEIVAAGRTSDDARLYARAIRKESLGDVAGALALLREVVQKNGAHAPAWNRLGLLLMIVDKDFDAATAAFERAAALDPDDATYRNNLGKAADAAERRGVAGVLRRLARPRR